MIAWRLGAQRISCAELHPPPMEAVGSRKQSHNLEADA